MASCIAKPALGVKNSSTNLHINLNLNVGRSYKAGDGVKDADKIRWAKGLTLFDPRLIELQKDAGWDEPTDQAHRAVNVGHSTYEEVVSIQLKTVLSEAGGLPEQQLALFALLNLGLVESLASGSISAADAVRIFFHAENCLCH